MSKLKKAIVLNDIHIPKQNKAALSCALKSMKLIKPDYVILNGDIMDCGFCSRHSRFHPPKCNWTDSQFFNAAKKDYQQMNWFLDQVEKNAPKAQKIYQLGNHEMWLKDFIKESPQTRQGLFGLEERLSLKKRKYKVLTYNQPIKLGKLKIIHGTYTSQHHAKKHVESYASSVLYGHLHDIQVYSKVTDDAITHMGWCNGCLCDLNPDYLRNKPQNWSHGFAVVYVWPNGHFQVDVIRIHKGRCVVEGKEIVG